MVKTFYLSNGLKVAMEYMPQYRSVSMGVWAVSYTHLDVYKRQRQDGTYQLQ